MGEAADMMLEGLCCSTCGEYLDGDEPGHPRECAGCSGSPDDDEDLSEHPLVVSLDHLADAAEFARKNPNAKKVRVDLEHLERVLTAIKEAFKPEDETP